MAQHEGRIFPPPGGVAPRRTREAMDICMPDTARGEASASSVLGTRGHRIRGRAADRYLLRPKFPQTEFVRDNSCPSWRPEYALARRARDVGTRAVDLRRTAKDMWMSQRFQWPCVFSTHGVPPPAYFALSKASVLCEKVHMEDKHTPLRQSRCQPPPRDQETQARCAKSKSACC